MTVTTRTRAQRGFFVANFAEDGLNTSGGLTARTDQVATFSRGGTAGAALVCDSNGRWSTVGTSTPRLHYTYNASTGLYDSAGVLLEPQRINSALGASSWADATYWANSAGFTIATATSCIQGQTAYKHTDAAGGAVRTQNIGTFVSGQTDTASFILEDPADGNASSDITIYDATVAGALFTARVTWSTKAIATLTGTGTCGIINYGNGRYRAWAAAAGVGAGAVAGGAGNTRQARIAPVVTAGKSCILHHAQFEAAASFPSSPIVTVGSAVTRSADALSFPFNAAVQAITVYASAVSLGWVYADSGNYDRLWQIGNYSSEILNSGLCLGTGKVCVSSRFSGTSPNANFSVSGGVAIGDLCELRGVTNSNGSLVVGFSKNGGTEQTATNAGVALGASLTDKTIYVGRDSGTTANAFVAISSFKIAAGVQTFATMRAL